MRSAIATMILLLGLPVAGQAQAPDLSQTDPAYAAALRSAIPFTPDQVTDLMNRFNADQRVRSGVGNPATLVSALNRRVNLGFAPGGVTPIIQAAVGYPATLSFFDRSGRPWPVAGDSNGNPATDTDPSGFTVRRPIANGNTVQVTVRGTFPRGGLVVYLEGAPAPLTFQIVTGTGAYDARAAVHVSSYRPGAEPTEVDSAIPVDSGDPAMEAMLQGITPAGARALAISGASPDEVRAWRSGGDLYLRSPYPILAPEPSAQMSAEGGVRIYRLPINTATGDMAISMATGTRNSIVRVRTN